jgi:hypothetical protein
VAVSPVTGAVYVTGSSMGSATSGEDYTTIGYRGRARDAGRSLTRRFAALII